MGGRRVLRAAQGAVQGLGRDGGACIWGRDGAKNDCRCLTQARRSQEIPEDAFPVAGRAAVALERSGKVFAAASRFQPHAVLHLVRGSVLTRPSGGA